MCAAGVQINDLPNLQKWFKRIEARPAVQKGLNIPEPNKFSEAKSDEEVQVRGRYPRIMLSVIVWPKLAL